MLDRFVERGIGGLVQTMTGGHFRVEKNSAFEEEWKKIQAESRNLATRIYDSGTLFIVDDTKHVVVPRFIIRKR